MPETPRDVDVDLSVVRQDSLLNELDVGQFVAEAEGECVDVGHAGFRDDNFVHERCRLSAEDDPRYPGSSAPQLLS